MKYVMGVNSLAGHMVPVVFDEIVTHQFVAAALVAQKLSFISAGFVRKVDGEWVVGAEKSSSLGIGPRSIDQDILRIFLNQGLSGLDLANMIAFQQIEARKKKRKVKA